MDEQYASKTSYHHEPGPIIFQVPIWPFSNALLMIKFTHTTKLLLFGISQAIRRRMSNDCTKNFNGVQLRSEVLTLQYLAGKPLLKAIKKKTAHLTKLGIHRPDGDFLTIEAALYLTELGVAMVLDHTGKPLTIEQLYTLLAQKYAVFAQLTRTGYVLRQPNANSSAESPQKQVDYSIKVQSFHFSKELLDQFPHIVNANQSNTLPAFHLHLPLLQFMPDSSVLFAADDSNSQMELSQLNGPMNERIKQSESQLLSKVRRWDRNPWEQYRPRYWPSFHSLQSAENWKVYELRKEGLLRKTRANRGGKSAQKRDPGYDYNVFADGKSSAKPLYRVLIVDERFPTGHPNFGEIQRLAASEGAVSGEERKTLPPLLVATGTPTSIKFSQIQAENQQSLGVSSHNNGPNLQEDPFIPTNDIDE